MKKDIILHETFEISLLLKGLNATLEVILGLLLLFLSPQFISSCITSLIPNFNNFFSNYLTVWVSHFSAGSQFFVAIYLFSHGAIKLFLLTFLWMGKKWAYLTAIIFFFLFIFYQIYRYSFTHSVWLIVLTVFDAAVIYLTWVECQRIKQVKLR